MNGIEWIVIHISHSKEDAERLLQLLTDEGFLVRLRDRASMNVWELLSTPADSVEARNFLIDNLQEQE